MAKCRFWALKQLYRKGERILSFGGEKSASGQQKIVLDLNQYENNTAILHVGSDKNRYVYKEVNFSRKIKALSQILI